MNDALPWILVLCACAIAVQHVWYANVTERSRDACMRGWRQSNTLNDEALTLINDALALLTDAKARIDRLALPPDYVRTVADAICDAVRVLGQRGYRREELHAEIAAILTEKLGKRDAA